MEIIYDDRTALACDGCRSEFTPGEKYVLAVQLIDTPSMSGLDEPVEGLNAHFHGRRYPSGSRRWRRVTDGVSPPG